MAHDGKAHLSSQIEVWSRYIGLVSALVSVITSLTGNPVVAYMALGVLGVIVGEHCIRVIFQKSPIQQAYQVLLPPSIAERGELVYRYPPGQRRRAIIWLAILASVFLSVGGFNLWQALKPPVARAGEKETLVLIVEFQTKVPTKAKHDFPELIYQGMEQPFKDTDGIRVEPPIYDIVVDSSDAARELGYATNATLVIWGKFDDDYVYPKYEVIKGGEYIEEPDLEPVFMEKTEIDFILRTEIPSAIEYITNFTIGQIYYLAGEYEEALDYFGAAKDILHEILEKSRVLEIERGESLDWEEESVDFYRGNTYANQGWTVNALRSYELAIEKKPRFAEAYNNLGVVFLTRADEEMALMNFELAIEENEELAVAYYNRGVLYYTQGNYAAAISDFSKAIDAEHLPLFYRVRADAYFCSHEYELARDDLTTAIRSNKYDPEGQVRALTNRGVVQKELGEYEKALKDFKQALRLDPDFALANYNMAATEATMGEAEVAIEALKMAIQSNEHLAAAAACDPDFDRIRDDPQMPALSLPPEGCEPVVCPQMP